MTVTESGTKRINYHVRDGPLALTRHEARERHTLSRPLYTTHWTDGDSESALRNLWRECQSLRVPLLWLVNKTSWLPLWYGWILLYRLIFTSYKCMVDRSSVWYLGVRVNEAHLHFSVPVKSFGDFCIFKDSLGGFDPTGFTFFPIVRKVSGE